jgi:hypothetical protein
MAGFAEMAFWGESDARYNAIGASPASRSILFAPCNRELMIEGIAFSARHRRQGWAFLRDASRGRVRRSLIMARRIESVPGRYAEHRFTRVEDHGDTTVGKPVSSPVIHVRSLVLNCLELDRQ